MRDVVQLVEHPSDTRKVNGSTRLNLKKMRRMIMKSINMEKTGSNISNIIFSKDISVKEVSDMLGFSSTRSVYKWLSGQTLPSLDSLIILSEILETTMDELIIAE